MTGGVGHWASWFSIRISIFRKAFANLGNIILNIFSLGAFIETDERSERQMMNDGRILEALAKGTTRRQVIAVLRLP